MTVDELAGFIDARLHALAGIPELTTLVATCEAARDDASLVEEIVGSLEATLARYRRELPAGTVLTRLRLHWAGFDVSPWVATDVFASAYAGSRLVFDSLGGFSPAPLLALADAADGSSEIADHDRFDELRDLFFATSLQLAHQALTRIAIAPAFSALPTARPFLVTASPELAGDRLVLLES